MPGITINGFEDRIGPWALDANGEFELAYNRPVASLAERLFNMLCPKVTSTQIIERFAGFKGYGEVLPFEGSVPYRGLDNWQTTIENAEYALGVRMRRRDLLADQKNLDRLMRSPSILAEKAIKNRLKLLSQLLVDNPTWGVDGVALFSDSHEFGDNNIGVTVSSTSAMTEADINLILDTAWETFAGFTDDHGNPLIEIADASQLVIIGATTHFTSFRRMQKQTLIPRSSAAVDNIEKEMFDYWGNPRLSSGTVLYVAVTEPTDEAGNPLGDSAPFARTEFDPYQLVTNIGDPGSDTFRNLRQVEVTIQGDEGVGVIDASRVLKVTLST